MAGRARLSRYTARAAMPDTPAPEIRAQAQQILKEAIVIDTLGGAVVHPTPYVAEGTYEERMVSQGWNVLHACLVSEPSYSPTFEQLLSAVYENLLNFEMSPKVRHVEKVEDIFEAKRNGQLGVIFGVQNSSWIGQERERIRLL